MEVYLPPLDVSTHGRSEYYVSGVGHPIPTRTPGRRSDSGPSTLTQNSRLRPAKTKGVFPS